MSDPETPPQETPEETPEKTPRSLLTRLALGAVLLVLALGLVVVAALFAEQESLPQQVNVGPEAEALADRIERAIDLPAWERTRAVSWTFGGRHTHLWDRARGLAEVRWGPNRVLLKLDDQSGRAWVDQAEVTESTRLRQLLDHAWAYFCNDSFWLNPLAKLRDTGTTRGLVAVEGDGREGLLVRYATGGVTPGDAYLWIVGSDGLPVRYKMWVSILPVGGVDATWEDWVTLKTGAKISTKHQLLLGLTLRITDVKGATSLAELLGSSDDPFAPLF